MAVLKKEEFESAIKSIVGDRSDDDALAFLENMTDTYNDLISNAGEDWKTKYTENDNQWRERYRARFFSGPQPGDDEFRQQAQEVQQAAPAPAEHPNPESNPENVGFDDLFTSSEV